jgi:hypothetical protein
MLLRSQQSEDKKHQCEASGRTTISTTQGLLPTRGIS